MRLLVVAAFLAGLAGSVQAQEAGPARAIKDGQVIPVWPGVAPGSEGWTHQEIEYRNGERAMVRNVVTPTLTAFLPEPAKATGTAVVICPGGGFRWLSWQSEGTAVAEWLRARGVAAFVLKYRLKQTAATEDEFRLEREAFLRGLANRDPKAADEEQKLRELSIADGRQALKLVRQHAGDWGIQPDRIGILGFSAGGVVTMGVVMNHDAQSQPNFAAPIYGGNTGGAPVPDDAPPLFILCASDDTGPATSSVQLYAQWREANRPAELHMYEKQPFDKGLELGLFLS